MVKSCVPETVLFEVLLTMENCSDAAVLFFHVVSHALMVLFPASICVLYAARYESNAALCCVAVCDAAGDGLLIGDVQPDIISDRATIVMTATASFFIITGNKDERTSLNASFSLCGLPTCSSCTYLFRQLLFRHQSAIDLRLNNSVYFMRRDRKLEPAYI